MARPPSFLVAARSEGCGAGGSSGIVGVREDSSGGRVAAIASTTFRALINKYLFRCGDEQ